MTKAGERLLSAAKEMTEMTTWKARAEDLERECAQSMETIAAERARAEAAEARVKELEADRDYWKIEAEGERAKVARRDRQRLTVTDEMVERAEAELDALFSGSPNCTLSDIARAALTAAMETCHD